MGTHPCAQLPECLDKLKADPTGGSYMQKSGMLDKGVAMSQLLETSRGPQVFLDPSFHDIPVIRTCTPVSPKSIDISADRRQVDDLGRVLFNKSLTSTWKLTAMAGTVYMGYQDHNTFDPLDERGKCLQTPSMSNSS